MSHVCNVTGDTQVMKPVMKPLDALKKGLRRLRDQSSLRKALLEDALKAGKPISAEDEDWLDNAGNLVDEEQLIDKLDKAVDYESTCKTLNPQEMLVVERLMGFVNHNVDPENPGPPMAVAGPGRKRKHDSFLIQNQIDSTLNSLQDLCSVQSQHLSMSTACRNVPV